MDLVQVLGADRLLQDVPREHAEHAHGQRHRQPAHGREHPQRGDRHDRGDESQQVGDDLPAEDQHLFGVLELVADEQREVEQRPRCEEVHEDEHGDGRQQIEREFGPPHELQYGSVIPEGHREAKHLAAGVDKPGAGELAEPEHVGGEDAGPKGQHHWRRTHGRRAHERRHTGLGQVGVLAQAHRHRAEKHHHREQGQRGDRLAGPARVQRRAPRA